jgi:hypothetical protein
MARSRGKKSKLPPRVRLKRWIPRLSRLDFASREIIEALTAARGNFQTMFLLSWFELVRLGRVGRSFHLGRTSILFPWLPHLAQTTWLLKYGNSVSAG